MEARRQNMQHPQPMPPQSQARGGRQPQQVPPQGAQPQDAGVPKEQMPPKRAGESQEPQQVPPQKQEPDVTSETVIPDKTDKEKEKDGESKL